jgi:hypothetical protein
MSYHLHWLPGYKRGEVKKYIHDHHEPSQAHFYRGDIPLRMILTGSYPAWPRHLAEGERNVRYHLRYPDSFGEFLILCGVKPTSLSLSPSGEVTCARCARYIHPMAELEADMAEYRQTVDIVRVEENIRKVFRY